MKHLILFTFLFTTYFTSFAQTKLIIDHKGGTKDSIAVNTISQIRFSSSDIPEPSLLEVQQILDTTAAMFLQYADSTNGDPWQALMLTANWDQYMPTVQSVYTIDSTYLDIVLKSGLRTDFYFNPVDDSGYSILRGGGVKYPEQAPISFAGLSKNTITNKKVLIYAPAYTDLNLKSTVPKTVSTITKANLGLDVTVLKDEVCTPAITGTFKDYGLIIMDTHGLPDAFMSGSIINISKLNYTTAFYKAAVIQQLGQDVYNGLIKNDYRAVAVYYIPINTPNWQKRKNLKAIENVYVTTQYIKTLAAMPNTVLFGNMCYSGYSILNPKYNISYPIRTAFLDKNPISYYCFALNDGKSTSVTDDFSKEMEDTLTWHLVNDLDSTGRANLHKTDGVEFYDTYLVQDPKYQNIKLLFKHFGADDYSYAKCGDTLIDTRDGQKYATVCIGNRTWMAQNLNYNEPGSLTYNNDPANGKTYGRLYDFKTLMQGADSTTKNPSGVQGACPKGWHIPSNIEYALMEGLFGGSQAAGGLLKSTSLLWHSPNAGATNSTGFSGLPGGHAYEGIPSATFTGLGDEANFATTTLAKSGNWLVWILSASDSFSGTTGVLQNTAVSCRCVKDP